MRCFQFDTLWGGGYEGAGGKRRCRCSSRTVRYDSCVTSWKAFIGFSLVSGNYGWRAVVILQHILEWLLSRVVS